MLFRCNNCGGNVVYDPQSKQIKCLYCGGVDCESEVPSSQPEQCLNCGSQIPYKQFDSATKCPACGTYVLRDQLVSYPYAADLILPFQISKRDAEEKLKAEFGRKLFLPSTFLSEKTLENLRGMYVPFWLYDYDTNVEYSAIGTKVRTWTTGDREYTETSYFDIYRRLHIDYQKVPADASILMDDKIMDLMEPYDYSAMITHSNKYISGFDAETYNMPPQQIENRAREKVTKANHDWISQYTSGYSSKTNVRFTDNNALKKNKFALLPVWVYEYRYQGQNYVFHVNGQTGKCVGTAPLSAGKGIGLTALLLGALTLGIAGIAMFLGVI